MANVLNAILMYSCSKPIARCLDLGKMGLAEQVEQVKSSEEISPVTKTIQQRIESC